ncbi:TPA: hypothetical protein ACG3IY_003310 [Clostridioides difficile]
MEINYSDEELKKLKESHPTLHEYCMNELGIRKVLKYMNFESE